MFIDFQQFWVQIEIPSKHQIFTYLEKTTLATQQALLKKPRSPSHSSAFAKTTKETFFCLSELNSELCHGQSE